MDLFFLFLFVLGITLLREGRGESLAGAKALPATSMLQKDGNSCIYIRLSTQFSKPLNGA